MSRRMCIFSGGDLGVWALAQVRADDILIGADRGALFLIEHQLRPTISLGDFDSVTEGEREKIKQCSEQFEMWDPVMKDWTDTELAIRWALEHGATEILLFGVRGSRIDHSLANLQLLLLTSEAGVPCSMITESEIVQLVERDLTVVKGDEVYVSFLPLTSEVTGITLRGFQYPLTNATIRLGESVGLSNRIVAEQASVSLSFGKLLMIRGRVE